VGDYFGGAFFVLTPSAGDLGAMLRALARDGARMVANASDPTAPPVTTVAGTFV